MHCQCLKYQRPDATHITRAEAEASWFSAHPDVMMLQPVAQTPPKHVPPQFPLWYIRPAAMWAAHQVRRHHRPAQIKQSRPTASTRTGGMQTGRTAVHCSGLATHTDAQSSAIAGVTILYFYGTRLSGRQASVQGGRKSRYIRGGGLISTAWIAVPVPNAFG